MNQSHLIQVQLNESINIEVFKSIIEKGIDLGFTYYPVISSGIDFNSPGLSASQALQALLDHTESGECRLIVQIDKAWFVLNLLDCEEVTIRFSALRSNRIKKYYNDVEDIDFAYYINIMLDLISDFMIIRLKAF